MIYIIIYLIGYIIAYILSSRDERYCYKLNWGNDDRYDWNDIKLSGIGQCSSLSRRKHLLYETFS